MPLVSTASGTQRNYSAAQRRTLSAALELFAVKGVSATSLQMIAEALGVTKAAVYHQFRAKEEIVLAVAEVELAPLRAALATASKEPSGPRVKRMVLVSLIDAALANRWAAALIGRDPVIHDLLSRTEWFAELLTGLYGTLVDAEDDEEARVAVALLSSAISGAIVHPWLSHMDDEALRRHLITVAQRLFGIDDSRRRARRTG